MVTRLFDHWNLPDKDRCLLLGLSPTDRLSLDSYRQGGDLFELPEQVERAEHLLAIHKSLRIIFPKNRELAYRWISLPNRRFKEQRPLDIMSRDLGGLLEIRSYLEREIYM